MRQLIVMILILKRDIMKSLIVITALLSFSASLYASEVMLSKQNDSEMSSLIEVKNEISTLGKLIAQENDVYSRDSMIDTYRDLMDTYRKLRGCCPIDIALWQLLINN